MISKQILNFLSIALLISACETNRKTQEQILSEIFPQLIDSLDIQWKPIPLPPPPRITTYHGENVNGYDSAQIGQIYLKHHKYLQRMDSIKYTTVFINEDLVHLDLEDFISHTDFSDSLIRTFKAMHGSGDNLQTINVSQMSVEGIKFITISDTEKEKFNLLKKTNDHKFGGFLKVSDLYLNNSGTQGLIQLDYYPNLFSGYSHYIVIEKVDKKWQVKRMYQNWIGN